MSNRHRNTWGMNFQKSDSPYSCVKPPNKECYNNQAPPASLCQASSSISDVKNKSGPYSKILEIPAGAPPPKAQSSTSATEAFTRHAFTGLGKRRIRDDDEYFNDEAETATKPALNDDLEYLPAPGSPGGKSSAKQTSTGHAAGGDDEDSDDPLEAYMSGIEKEVKSQKNEAAGTSEAPSSSSDGNNIGNKKGIRLDLEKEDEIEEYLRFMKENPHVGVTNAGDDDATADTYEYDSDGNVIAREKKAIEPLPPTDHSLISYDAFEKNFYEPHAEIKALSHEQVAALQRKLGIRVRGILPPKPVCAFAHLQFDSALLAAIRQAGYTQPSPIQSQAVPSALAGRDVIGIAKTGSGKTAAYLWPMIVHIMDQAELRRGDGPIGLVVAPTRELVQQIWREARRFAEPTYNIRVVCGYGGGSMWEQQRDCEAGCEILIGTPGRLIDLIKKKSTNLRRVTFLVFDEADKMFNMGFEAQVRSIAKNVRSDRQTLFFSATFKSKIERLTRDILNDPIKIIQGEINEANEDVTQHVQLFSSEEEKWSWLLLHLPGFLTEGTVLIFVTRKLHAQELSQRLLLAYGTEFCRLIHGDMHQSDRNAAITAFRNSSSSSSCRVLVATDVAARGLDIPSICHVINYEVARDIDTHTHRVGRTGRAGNKGHAHTLVMRPGDKEFCAHLVRNLEGANQSVPEELLAMANQNAWFCKNRSQLQSNEQQQQGGGGGLEAQSAAQGGRQAGGGGGGSGNNKKLKGKSLGRKLRPGLGLSEKDARAKKNEDADGGGIMTTTDFSDAVGPQSDRISAMRSAFQSQYQRMFVSAGVEGCHYLHPERVGETSDAAPCSAADNEASNQNTSSSSTGTGRIKKSRWN